MVPPKCVQISRDNKKPSAASEDRKLKCIAWETHTFCLLFSFISAVQKYLKVHEDESDLTGRVKELGRMFEGGGPMFPKSTKNDKDKGN